MNDKWFVDTNILVYSYEKNSNEALKSKKCFELISQCFEGKIKLFVSNQVLAEFCWVITKKTEFPLPISEAKKLISFIHESNNWIKLNYTTETIFRALTFVEKYKIPLWDALIAATMLSNNVYSIYTENEKDFSKITELHLENILK